MRKLLGLLLIVTLLLSGCGTVRPAPTVVERVCPRIPPLEQPPAAQEPSFTARMDSFLSGSLPGLSDYSLSSSNAKPGIKPPRN